MLSPDLFQLVIVIVVSVSAAGGAFVLSETYFGRAHRSAREMMVGAEDSIVFLFDDADLIDTTPAARSMFKTRNSDASDLDEFIRLFGPHFPHLRHRLSTLADCSPLTLVSPDNTAVRLEAEYWDGLVRLTFRDEASGSSSSTNDTITVAALEEEVETLRAIAQDAPQLVWKEDGEGRITWANRAYLNFADQVRPASDLGVVTWPPAKIFEESEKPSELSPRVSRRLPAQGPATSDPHWFEVTSVFRGSEIVHFAVDADAVVRAEETRRSFVQTLGKTFAELSIGLAIFDRKRRLMTFNPALIELTGLGFEFLSSRPLIHTLLDRLREARMLPEPKNYVTWREEIAALESAAKNGTYCETWDLPNGQTYRVTGRPHPDGAVALLFEDISAEISLTRRFRSEIETARAVVDSVDVAVAVFSQTGALIMSNSAYSTLWNLSPKIETGLTIVTAVEATRHWQDLCAPTGIWSQIREYVSGFGDRSAFSETLTMTDGRQIVCRVSALPGAASMVTFTQAQAELRAAPRLKRKERLTLSA